MAEMQTQDAVKQEVETVEGAERTRANRAYVPRADIYETENDIIIVTDMPGVSQDSIDITVEKNVLSIDGYVNEGYPDNYDLAHMEYEVGDYHRKFTLSNAIDQENIAATVKNGVLRLVLPKAGPAKARKINVQVA